MEMFAAILIPIVGWVASVEYRLGGVNRVEKQLAFIIEHLIEHQNDYNQGQGRRPTSSH